MFVSYSDGTPVHYLITKINKKFNKLKEEHTLLAKRAYYLYKMQKLVLYAKISHYKAMCLHETPIF